MPETERERTDRELLDEIARHPEWKGGVLIRQAVDDMILRAMSGNDDDVAFFMRGGRHA